MTTIDIDCRHGRMRVFEQDPWTSRSLRELGEYSEEELLFLQQVIQTLSSREGPIEMIEAGAFIGDMTIPLSRMVKRLYAFEPQEEVREVLLHNLAANNIRNVEVFPYAIGSSNGTTSYHSTPSKDGPGGTLMAATGAYDHGDHEVQMVTLDSLGLNPALIKADIEGMEPKLVEGGLETLARTRCPLFMEFDAVVYEGMPSLAELLASLGYDVFMHYFPMWRPGNWKQAPNPFGSTISKMLYAVPPIF